MITQLETYFARPAPYLAADFTFKRAEHAADVAGFWRLRRETFCAEQGIFRQSDRDEIDDNMIPLVCTARILGMDDQVVGAVRIAEVDNGIWWGSRLCVAPDYRRIGGLSPVTASHNRLPAKWSSIGAGLIYLAVTTARAKGCELFLANVQIQNVGLFRSLHWQAIEEIAYHGRAHMKMRADLNFYPPRSVGER